MRGAFPASGHILFARQRREMLGSAGRPREVRVSESVDTHSEDPIEIRDSRVFYALWGDLALLLAAVSAASWAWGPFGLLGLVGLGVFGTHSLWAFQRLFHRRVRLRITEEGVVDENFWYSPGLIKWDEILDVRVTRWGRIEIDLVDENEFLARLSGPHQLGRVKQLAQSARAIHMVLLGFGPAAIASWGLEGSRAEIVEMLEAGMDRYALSVVREGDALEPGEASTI